MEKARIRFFSKVNKDHPSGCWLWTANSFNRHEPNHDYGNFKFRNTPTLAHRFSYELVNGKIPEGLLCLHRCDTPRCVRPDHLFLGTSADNAHDRDDKGRHNPLKGEACKHSKMNNSKVIEMRSRYAAGEKPVRLAKHFGISLSSTCKILDHSTWKHV